MSEIFEKFGKIERVVLARDIPSSKRKDYAFVNYTTREAAISCIELIEKEELVENGSKVRCLPLEWKKFFQLLNCLFCDY
jgi:RNA recognition motif-containing protein